MGKPTIIAAGLGRCGSSLVMQMLHATGVECAGTYPDFEEDFTPGDYLPASRLLSHGAYKLLSPNVMDFDAAGLIGNAIVIWLDRDPDEQAKSHIKFMAANGIDVPSDTPPWRWREQLRKDREESRAVLSKLPTLKLTFERIIITPLDAANAITDFAMQHGIYLDAHLMAARVLERGIRCEPDMRIEAALVERSEADHAL